MVWNKKTHEQFLKELAELRPDLSTEDVYVNNKTKMLFTCNKGHKWNCAPNHVLNDKTMCRVCRDEKLSTDRLRTHEDFVSILKAINSVFTVVGEYKGANIKVDVVCDKGHSSSVFPSNAVRGSSCRECVDYGKFRDIPTTLYYVKFNHDGRDYYKIDLTQKSLSRRFVGEEARKMTLLYETVYDSPALAWEAEQSVLKAFREFTTKDKVLRKGNTEVFNSDILHLDSYQMEEETWR